MVERIERGGGDIYLILKNRSNIDHINICPFHEARFLTCGSVIEDMLFFARFFPAVSFPRFVTYPISRSAIDEGMVVLVNTDERESMNL